MNKLSAFQILGMMSALPRERPVKIPSHKIERKKTEEQLSCRRIQRMKGKKARKNRGKNRRRSE